MNTTTLIRMLNALDECLPQLGKHREELHYVGFDMHKKLLLFRSDNLLVRNYFNEEIVSISAAFHSIDPDCAGAKMLDIYALPQIRCQDLRIPLRPEYTLDALMERGASAEIVDVVKNFDSQPNIMWLYGSGVEDKIRTLHTIGNQVQKAHPEAKIVYYDSCEFRADFVSNVKDNKHLAFYLKCCEKTDLFLLSDIDLVAGMEFTELELYNIFLHILNRGGKVVVTAQCPSDQAGFGIEHFRGLFKDCKCIFMASGKPAGTV